MNRSTYRLVVACFCYRPCGHSDSLVLADARFLLGAMSLASNVFFLDIEYLINLGLLIAFLVAAATCWKRLILYQKSKWLILWMVGI